MRRIGDKAALQRHRLRYARQQAVDCYNKRTDFGRQAHVVQMA